MRAAMLFIAGALCALPATAQTAGATYWEYAAPRAFGGVRLLSAATLNGLSDGSPETLLAASATIRLPVFTAAIQAGAWHDPNTISSAGASLSTQWLVHGTRLDIRAGAAVAPDEHRGPSITTLGAALGRGGLSLSLRSSWLPATREQTSQIRVTERDTTYFLNHIVPAQPRRTYTDLELAYERAFGGVLLDGGVGYRVGADIERQSWVRVGALLHVASAFAIGGSLARDPGAPWLESRARNAFRVFVRVDPVRAASPRAIPVTARQHPLRISSDGATTFAFISPRASTVEIAGTFSDWRPVALQRQPGGTWSVTLPLAPGVYHIALRVDGRAWRAPPGLAAVPDEFGGEAGVFEVR